MECKVCENEIKIRISGRGKYCAWCKTCGLVTDDYETAELAKRAFIAKIALYIIEKFLNDNRQEHLKHLLELPELKGISPDEIDLTWDGEDIGITLDIFINIFYNKVIDEIINVIKTEKIEIE